MKNINEEELTFAELNALRKIEQNSYLMYGEFIPDINILRKLSKVTGVEQEVFYIYKDMLELGFNDKEDFFLNENVDLKVKRMALNLATSKHLEPSCEKLNFLFENKYLKFEEIDIAFVFISNGFSNEVATSYKYKLKGKDANYIKCAVKNGLDKEKISKLIKNGYRLSAVYAYSKSLKEGIDVLKYLEGNYIGEIDKTVCEALFEIIKSDKDFEKRNYKEYFRYNFTFWKYFNQLEQMDVDITKINKKMINEYCLRQLIALKNKDVDITKYMDKVYDFRQLEEIGKGIEGGLDVSLYENNEYKYAQMQVIRRALKYNKETNEKIDVSLICNPTLSFEEMQHIVFILKRGTLEEKLEIMRKYNNSDSLNKERNWHEYR